MGDDVKEKLGSEESVVVEVAVEEKDKDVGKMRRKWKIPCFYEKYLQKHISSYSADHPAISFNAAAVSWWSCCECDVGAAMAAVFVWGKNSKLFVETIHPSYLLKRRWTAFRVTPSTSLRHIKSSGWWVESKYICWYLRSFHSIPSRIHCDFPIHWISMVSLHGPWNVNNRWKWIAIQWSPCADRGMTILK